MKTLILIFLFASPVFAKTVEWNGERIDYSDEFSLKSYSMHPDAVWAPLDIPMGTTVYSSGFTRGTPETMVFSDTMVGVTFIECALDNVLIPAGNIVKNVYNPAPIEWTVQNDGEPWVIDKQGNPIEPINKERYLEVGFSIDPADIPATKSAQSLLSDELYKRSEDKFKQEIIDRLQAEIAR